MSTATHAVGKSRYWRFSQWVVVVESSPRIPRSTRETISPYRPWIFTSRSSHRCATVDIAHPPGLLANAFVVQRKILKKCGLNGIGTDCPASSDRVEFFGAFCCSINFINRVSIHLVTSPCQFNGSSVTLCKRYIFHSCSRQIPLG